MLNKGGKGLVDNPFIAKLLKTFEEPVPGQLFIDGADESD